jgi:hypothetical protein
MAAHWTCLYFTIVKASCLGAERCPALSVAVMVTVYLPGGSLFEREMRPWKETLSVPAFPMKSPTKPRPA